MTALFADAESFPVVGDWMRSGSCDQCAAGPIKGECCTKLTFPVTPSAARNPDVLNFFRLHGVAVKWWGDLPIAVIPMRCAALTPGGDCALYGQPDRPQVCSDGPLNAWAAHLNPHCSFHFEQAEEQG